MGSEQNFRLPANAPASVLETYLDAHGATLLELHLTNNRIAEPDELCHLIIRAERLHTLECIASCVKARHLLPVILRPLEHLTRLEFSMVDEEDEARRQIDQIGKPTEGASCQPLAGKIRCMYVEVAGDANFDLLDLFLEYCPNVIDLHVHLVSGNFDSAVLRCANVLANRPLMETFAFTSELPSPMPLEPPAALNFGHCAHAVANVLYRREGQTWNCKRLRDLVTSTAPALPEPLIVVAVLQDDLEEQIRQAGELNTWDVVNFLCLVLLSPPARGGSPHAAVIGTPCCDALATLFGLLKNLTELNVNSFHFADGVDLTVLLLKSSLRLRAISLPPCALRPEEALLRLKDCGNIDDLDIRSGYDGPRKVCQSCESGLYLQPFDFVDWGMRGRLTVFDVHLVRHLAFVDGCKLAELRIVDSSPNPLHYLFTIGALLKYTSTLRTLVLSYQGLDFNLPEFQADIVIAKQLHYLCLLSEANASDELAAAAVDWMARQFERLEAFHVHYRNNQQEPQQFTWLLNEHPQLVQGLVLPVPDIPGGERECHTYRGKPCILCSTQTFIALKKPRHRGHRSAV